MKRLCFHKALAALLLPLMLIFTSIAMASTDSPEMRRLRAGLDLFPSFLAADTAIQAKRARDGKLHIALVYQNNMRRAEQLAERLRHIDTIKAIPMEVAILQANEVDNYPVPLAGIFITQPQLNHLGQVIKYGKVNSLITFSPFPGDVAQGVTGGLSIKARILPQLNQATLHDSGLQLKPFFLRIATFNQ